jgi:uracil-DNA glycosylase
MNQFRYNIKPEGPMTAKLAVVCEKPHKDECAANRLLVGDSGQRVRRHLREAGLHAGSERVGDLSREVWLTNAVQSFNEIGNPSRADIIREMPRLFRELSSLPNLNCILAMGNVALEALTNFQLSSIGNWRGSIVSTAFGRKMVPTYHPAFYIRGEWRFAPVVQFDTNRAVKESSCPLIIRPFHNWYVRPSLPEAMAWFRHLKKFPISESPYLSFDIETTQGKSGTWYISCIAFSVEPTEAFCIPIMNRDRSPYWSELSTECLIWREIADLLSLPDRIYITQNGAAFDCPQLRKHGIRTPYMVKGFDTYSAHSLLAPDLPHSLEFIVSIYTEEHYYKDESGRGEGGFGKVAEDQFWIYNCKDAAFTLASALSMIKDMQEL